MPSPNLTVRGVRAAVVLAACVALTAVLGWASARRRPRFPARPADALSGSALEDALTRAQARLEKDPEDLKARVDLGVLYAQKGGEASVDAINELETAREQGSTDPDLPYYLGVLYQGEGLPAFALREYQRFLRTHPGHKETELLLAKLLYQTGKYKDAADRYESLRARFPKDPIVLENYGLSLLAARDLDRAREMFSALRERGGEPGRRAQYFLGNVALSASDYKEALKAYAAALPQGSEPPAGLGSAQVYAGLALASEGLGRGDLAMKAWTHVLEREPENLQAQARLIELRSPRFLKKGVALQRTRKSAKT